MQTQRKVRRKEWWIGSVTLLLLVFLAAGFLYAEKRLQSQQQGISAICFQTVSAGVGQNIKGHWEEETQRWYFFLPSYARTAEWEVSAGEGETILWNGEELGGGFSIAELEEGETCRISIQKGNTIIEEAEAVFLFSQNLPAVFIQTDTGSLDEIHADIEHEEGGYFLLIDEQGNLDAAAGMDYMRGRGNTSWLVPKKSYRIHLESKENFLGMGAAKDWLLQANYYDGTYIRNRLVFDIAKNLGFDYTVDSAFADVYINGDYRGMYQLTEKIEIGEDRVDLADGYLMEIDYLERLTEEDMFFQLENGQPILLHDAGNMEENELAELEAFFTQMQDALYAEDYRNRETGKGIFEYLDLDSWVDMYIMEEWIEDLDMGVTSHYMYMEKGGLLKEGPMWDMDNTLGRGGAETDPEEFWARKHKLSEINLARWYARLYDNPEFFQRLTERYQERFLPEIERMQTEGIDAYMEELRASIQMDQIRWPGERSTFMPDADLQGHLDYLKQYIGERISFLNQYWLEPVARTDEKTKLPETVLVSVPEDSRMDINGEFAPEEPEISRPQAVLVIGGIAAVLLAALALRREEKKWNR